MTDDTFKATLAAGVASVARVGATLLHSAPEAGLINGLLRLWPDDDGEPLALWTDASTGEAVDIKSALASPAMRERAIKILREWSQATARNAVIVGAIAIELGRRLPGLPGAKA
ncbi:MAG TPA: hypothetical protein VGF29_05015 [Hyphomicrobiaceae bacterium]|jgi:hypothetical protein